MKESDILYENNGYWVTREWFGTGRFKPKSEGYAVYKTGVTHSTRVASIGWNGARGLERAIAEADKKAAPYLADIAA